jgi:hypothetical protein
MDVDSAPSTVSFPSRLRKLGFDGAFVPVELDDVNLEGLLVPVEVDDRRLEGVLVPAELDDVTDPVAAALLVVFCRFPADFRFLLCISFRSFRSCMKPVPLPGSVGPGTASVGSVFAG